MATKPPVWKTQVVAIVHQLLGEAPDQRRYAGANNLATQQAVTGRGPDSAKLDARAGARMVVNIPAPHVPAFCEASRRRDPSPYKNCYDLKALRLGDDEPVHVSKTREVVDKALPLPRGTKPASVYFGAVELSGSGIRFYGDICLVLKADAVDAKTVVLDRNSYDVVRPPVIDHIASLPKRQQPAARRAAILGWSGSWGADLGDMAAAKVVRVLGVGDRRWTTGKISEALRDDEDYMEVLRIGSFGTAQLQEARIASSDAAHDALVGDRMRQRPRPSFTSLVWRNRRARAEEALRKRRVPVRIVTTSGRTKG
jgi:hypothetical protein